MCNFVAEANPCSCNESWGPWFMATTNALFVQSQEKFQLLFLEQDTCWWLRNTTKWSNSRYLMFAWAIWAFKKSHWQPTFAPKSKTWFMTALKLMLPWAKVELVLKASELIQQKIYFCMWRVCNQKTWLLCWRISESQTQYPPPKSSINNNTSDKKASLDSSNSLRYPTQPNCSESSPSQGRFTKESGIACVRSDYVTWMTTLFASAEVHDLFLYAPLLFYSTFFIFADPILLVILPAKYPFGNQSASRKPLHSLFSTSGWSHSILMMGRVQMRWSLSKVDIHWSAHDCKHDRCPHVENHLDQN